MADFDYVLVGGGLQNCLVALAVLQRRPDARVAVVERGPTLGSDHLWCFHGGDVPARARPLVDPLVCARWPSHEVRFPTRRRTLISPYAALSGELLGRATLAALTEAPHAEIYVNAIAAQVMPHQVTLTDGRVLTATWVIDARGPSMLEARNSESGYQTFWGSELETAEPHGVSQAILMDATVPQESGFRFMYVLPLSSTRLLVEDTGFSRLPTLDVERARTRVASYMRRLGIGAHESVRDEQGILPMPWAGKYRRPERGLVIGGYAGGWFHPATGYSIPASLRLALFFADCAESADSAQSISTVELQLQALFDAQQQQVSYAQFLNRLLFHLFPDQEMWNVFDRFYELPEAIIQRFYALELTTADRARLLVGAPPRGVSLRKALAAVRAFAGLGGVA